MRPGSNGTTAPLAVSYSRIRVLNSDASGAVGLTTGSFTLLRLAEGAKGNDLDADLDADLGQTVARTAASAARRLLDRSRQPIETSDSQIAVGILQDKKLLITGVLTDDSLAFATAQLAQREGAEVILTGFGRGLRLTQRTARKLDTTPEVLELDITDPAHASAVSQHLASTWGQLDGALHSIGFAPESCLGDDFWAPDWNDVATAVQISSYSLRTLADIVRPLMPHGGSLVGLTFDATVAWPAYNWMGMAKAGLESLNRYLARELGPEQIRCNLVAAGPMRTIAAKSIPGFAKFEDEWVKRAPLGWDVNDASGVARACAVLLSDWFPHTTGQIIHVDGGYSIVGA